MKNALNQDAQIANGRAVGSSDAEETNFRWAYALLVELAKVELAAANAEAAPGEWPAQQEWNELGGSSKACFLARARERAGIPHDKFLAGIRDGKYDVEDIYAKPSNASKLSHAAGSDTKKLNKL